MTVVTHREFQLVRRVRQVEQSERDRFIRVAASYNLTIARLDELADAIVRRAEAATKATIEKEGGRGVAKGLPEATVRRYWIEGLVMWHAANIAKGTELAAAQRRSLDSIALGVGFASADQLAIPLGLSLNTLPALFQQGVGDAA